MKVRIPRWRCACACVALSASLVIGQEPPSSDKPQPAPPKAARTKSPAPKVPAKPAATKPAATKPSPIPQPPPAPGSDPKTVDPATGNTSATIELIMDQAVENLARRYNLNDEQKRKTDEIMRRRVSQFLKDHENDVWPVIRDLLASQLGAKPPESPEDVRRIGKAARPLAELAEKAILEGNDEWREYLSDDQRTQHDRDLADMFQQFEKVNRNLDTWAAGKPSADGIFPPPPVEDGRQRRPSKPAAGLPQPAVESFKANVLDTLVEGFIRDCNLDPGQIDAARSILNESKAKVLDFRDSNKGELDRLYSDEQAAQKARDHDKLSAIDKSRRDCSNPSTNWSGRWRIASAVVDLGTALGVPSQAQGAPDAGVRSATQAPAGRRDAQAPTDGAARGRQARRPAADEGGPGDKR